MVSCRVTCHDNKQHKQQHNTNNNTTQTQHKHNTNTTQTQHKHNTNTTQTQHEHRQTTQTTQTNSNLITLNLSSATMSQVSSSANHLKNLLSPLNASNGLQFKNRAVLSPMTRSRANNAGDGC